MYEDELSKCFALFEQRLGKMLSPSDISTVLYIVNDMKLPTEVISLILDYALSKGIKSLRYIERIAIDWSDRGINTRERAKQFMDKLQEIQIGYLKVGREKTPRRGVFSSISSEKSDYKKGNGVSQPKKSKFNNYTDTNEIDYEAYYKKVMEDMLDE